MEFKRKCFLGHTPARPKEGRVAARKRIQESKEIDQDIKNFTGASVADDESEGDR